MAQSHRNHLFLLLLLSILFPASTAKEEKPTTAYEFLKAHGLPMGLLPKGVEGFTFDGAGRFRVALPSPCNAKFESEVHYDANVTGSVISYGRIGALSGISARELFLWFPVKGIQVDVPNSGIIYFDVGVIRKRLSLALFETPPDCHAASAPDSHEGQTHLLRSVNDKVAQKATV